PEQPQPPPPSTPPPSPATLPSTSADAATTAQTMIADAPDGQKHYVLLRASRLLGGYVAANRMDETYAISMLEEAIGRRRIDSFAQASKTIRDGIRYGKGAPIYATT